MKSLIIALLVAAALAECPSACSGHGDCKEKDQCDCHRNWAGADCSKRICPFGNAFIDTPQGDLNHDGAVTGTSDTQWTITNTWELYPNTVADEAHTYMECSNKGLCNRDVGECQCLPGYEGSACQRTVCPNKCTGHGVCRTVKQIAAGMLNKRFVKQENTVTVWDGVTMAFDYNLWDGDKGQACICDAGYTGPDCSLRTCPFGDDPLTYRKVDCAGTTCQDEVQKLAVGSTTEAAAGTFTLTYTTLDMQEFTTYPMALDTSITAAELAVDIKAALEALPNDVIPSVTVTVDTGAVAKAIGGTFLITFTENSGAQNALVVETTGTNIAGTVTSGPLGGTGVVVGNKEAVTCSNRGLCDYTTGLCKCFKGYTNYNCDTQSALAM